MFKINNINWSLLLDIPANHMPTGDEIAREAERQRVIETITGFSITALIMVIPIYLFIRYAYFKLKKEFRFKTKFNRYNHIDAMVLLSMNVLRTNPECFQEKCIYLKEYIVYLYPESTSFHESLKMAYIDVYRSESIVRWLGRFHSEEEQKDVVRFLIHMAAQDGVVGPREKTELFRIINTFGLVHKEWMDLIDSINNEFTERHNRWRKTHSASGENYRDSVIDKALDYFGMKCDALNEDLLRDKYRSLVKKYHPDRHPDATADQRNELEVQFQELQLYYEELLKLL